MVLFFSLSLFDNDVVIFLLFLLLLAIYYCFVYTLFIKKQTSLKRWADTDSVSFFHLYSMKKQQQQHLQKRIKLWLIFSLSNKFFTYICWWWIKKTNNNKNLRRLKQQSFDYFFIRYFNFFLNFFSCFCCIDKISITIWLSCSFIFIKFCLKIFWFLLKIKFSFFFFT